MYKYAFTPKVRARMVVAGGEGGLLKGISVWEVEMKTINVHWAKTQ